MNVLRTCASIGIVFCLLIGSVLPVLAQSSEADVQKQIEELQQKIKDAQSKERTLSNEIKGMDNKITLTQLQVTDTTKKITQLEAEIEDLGGKIGTLEVTLSKLSQLLLTRIVNTYKLNQITPLTILFSANGFSDFISRAKYLQIVQLHDRHMLTEVQQTKDTYAERKNLREIKITEAEALKRQLQIQQQQLAQQKKDKEVLLTQTKNDEATYQKLLAQALAEKQAIEAALVAGQRLGPVHAGDPIALVGNTGYPACSTGAHLHFELRRNNQWIDPAGFLKSRTVNDQQDGGNNSMGGGDWNWPLEGDIIVTQHFGRTPYSWRYTYSGGIHTGIDMYSSTSSVIRAPKDGTLYAASQNCGGSSVIKIKYIEHGDGLVSFYLHVQ